MFDFTPLRRNVKVVSANSEKELTDIEINRAIDEIVNRKNEIDKIVYISDVNGKLITCIIEYLT